MRNGYLGAVDQKEADLIQNELVPQFLGLWVKLQKEGVPAHTGQRGLALALLQANNHSVQTKNWYDNDTVNELLNEMGPIVDKYLKKGLHFSLISVGLEQVICQLLGTIYDPKLTPGNDSA